jgi:hypothetical protein
MAVHHGGKVGRAGKDSEGKISRFCDTNMQLILQQLVADSKVIMHN